MKKRVVNANSGVGMGVLAVLVLILGWLLWPSQTSAPEVPVWKVHGVASSASAPVELAVISISPAASASAPAVSEEVAEEEVKPAEKPEWHIVASGETLAGIAKQYELNWQQLCVHNRLSDCHNIQPNQSLNLVVTDESKALAKLAPHRYFEQKLRHVVIDCVKTKLGYCTFSRVGGDPVCRRDQVAILSRDFNLPKQEAEKWAGVSKERGLIKAGTMIDGLSFGSGYWSGPVKVMQDMPYQKGEVAGQMVGQFDACCNFFPLGPVPQPPEVVTPPVVEEPPPAPAPPAMVPPAVAEPSAPVPAPVTPPKEEGRASVCLFNPKGVIGQEHGLEHDGNDAHSTFLSAALTCDWRGTLWGDAGTHGIGVGLQSSWWSGHVNQGIGKFQGRMLAIGPEYSWTSDKSWNFEGKLLFGRIHEYFNQGDYASDRTINIVGPAVSVNLGQRRARGEKFLPETRLYGMWGLPTSVEAKHSWQGQPIADTTELSRFGSYLNLGVHQDVYDFQSFTLWGRAGYFRESPVSETANLRIGISDPQRICGVGIGYDFDLKNGGQEKGWGWWCDLAKGTQVIRSEYRLHQMVKETGATFEEDGTLFVPMPPVKPTD